MTDTAKAPGKPAAVKLLNGRILPGKPAIAMPAMPMPRSIGRVFGQRAGPLAAGHAEALAIGDKINILNPHDPSHATGTIQLVSGDTPYGVLIDGMEEMGIHKWYTTDEIELVATDESGAEGAAAAKKKKPMKMEASARPGLTVNGRVRPAALPVPADRNVSALARPSVLEKWNAEAAGIRAVEKGDNVITMFDVIGEDWWSGGGITAKSVTAQLRAIGDRPIEVQINSPGGDMFEGIAIYNVLREHPQPITIKIMGMAASAASIIAMAGDTVEIGAASFLMIHDCWVVAVGNRHDMAETAAYLEPFDQAMADVYAFRSGKTPEECAAWMDAETYMSGSVAIERGFADALLSADQTTVDEKAKCSDRERSAITALELKLVAGGDTRAQAREHITKIKGTPGAAHDTASTPGAAGTELVGSLANLLTTFSRNPE